MTAAGWQRSPVGVGICALLSLCPAHALAEGGLAPTAIFAQLGAAGSTRNATVGVAWDWDARRAFGNGVVTGYWEGAISQWSYPGVDDRRTAWLGQASVIPVFRYRQHGVWSAWFVELGVGLTVTTALYQTQQKRFSTRFNFGDHVALGRSFGAVTQHEIALRIEHFSNGGFREPNPGLNFVQIRYAYRYQ